MIRKIFCLIAALVVSLVMGGTAMASSGNYRANLTVKSGNTGRGLVYAMKESESTQPSLSLYKSSVTVLSEGNSKNPVKYYSFALAVRGYKFANWTKGANVSDVEDAAYKALVSVTGANAQQKDADGNSLAPAEALLTANFVADTTVPLKVVSPTNGTIDLKAEYYYLKSGSLSRGSYDYSLPTTEALGDIWNEDKVTLTAKGDESHKFLKWIDEEGNTISYSSNHVLDFSVATTYEAVFVSKSDNYFLVNGLLKSSWSEALTAASALASRGTAATIVVLDESTIPAGDWTIPANVTLLVPNDENYTVGDLSEPIFAEEPPTLPRGNKSFYGPVPNSTLTLADGAHLTVNGNICVRAALAAPHASQVQECLCPGCIYGPYGRILMENGSTITVNSGANLSAWGYISGEGRITANDGAKVYEAFQFTDWRGGTVTSRIYDGAKSYRVFPFHQYYVQNIEVPITFNYGAQEILQTGLNADYGTRTTSLNYISRPKTSSDGDDFLISMFTIQEGGSLTKYYDGNTDRQIYEINGNCQINGFDFNIILDYQGKEMMQQLKTSEYTLPLTSNMTLNIKSGGKLEIVEDVCMLPDCRVNVERGGNLQVDKALTLYSGKDWGNYSFPTPINPLYKANVPSMNFVRSNGSSQDPESENYRGLIGDATLCIDGTVTVNGALYATNGFNATGTFESSSAKITALTKQPRPLQSSIIGNVRGGKIVFAKTAPETTTAWMHGMFEDETYYYKNTHFCGAEAISAPLRNADGTVVSTINNPANISYIYNGSSWTPAGTVKTAGDVSGDNRVSILDITGLVNILTGTTSATSTGNHPADLNHDKTFDKDEDLELLKKKVLEITTQQ